MPVKEQDRFRDILWCCTQDDGSRLHLMEAGIEWLGYALIYGQIRKNDFAIDRALEGRPVAIHYVALVHSSHTGPMNLQAFYIFRNFGQIIVKLMPASIEFTNDGLWNFFCIDFQMCKRHPLVVAAMVQENRYTIRQA